MKPFLLFDFDGTIADSIQMGKTIANIMAPQYGHAPFSAEDFKRFRSQPMHKVLKELKIPFYKIPKAISQALIEYRHLIHELEPCEGVMDMLKDLTELSVPMALLSSNTRENLLEFLYRHQIYAFEWVEGTSGVLKKASRIRKQLKKHQLNHKQVIYIGDETRDIDSAHACGLKVIAVTWGFHSSELLCSHNPDYLVETPAEIVQIAQQLMQ